MESHALMSASRARTHLQRLLAAYKWTQSPFIVGAPMRVMSGPHLAVAISRAGGLGFIGPGAKPETTAQDLETAKELLANPPGKIEGASEGHLPIGVGFQVWNGDVAVAAKALETHRPCAAWLFAPRHGQEELDSWTRRLRESSPKTQVWIQVGTLREAMAACENSHAPDVLVVQGAEAGGHGRATDGMGLVSLLPEIAEATADTGIPLIAAGGIVDGRGVVAALGLGAAGVTLGTRFLASAEARISKGYQQDVLRTTDAATSTVRTHLYNHLRGTFSWPEQFSPRAITNRSWEDHQAEVPFEEIQRRHDEAAQKGDEGWGPDGRLAAYVGASVGLVREVNGAGEIVHSIRDETRSLLEALRQV